MKVTRTLFVLAVFGILSSVGPSTRGGGYEVPPAHALNSSTQTAVVTFDNVKGLTLSVPSSVNFGSVDFTAPAVNTGSASVVTNDAAGYALTVTGPTNFVSGGSTIPAQRLQVAASGSGGSAINLSSSPQTIKSRSAAFPGAGDVFNLTMTLSLLATDPVANNYSGTLTFTATGN